MLSGLLLTSFSDRHAMKNQKWSLDDVVHVCNCSPMSPVWIGMRSGSTYIAIHRHVTHDGRRPRLRLDARFAKYRFLYRQLCLKCIGVDIDYFTADTPLYTYIDYESMDENKRSQVKLRCSHNSIISTNKKVSINTKIQP